MTVWDGGGEDTYDFSAYTTNLTVDLGPGAWTTTSSAQLGDLGGYFYRQRVRPREHRQRLSLRGNTASLIENAIGGSGNDAIIGNQADNGLRAVRGTTRWLGGLATTRSSGATASTSA